MIFVPQLCTSFLYILSIFDSFPSTFVGACLPAVTSDFVFFSPTVVLYPHFSCTHQQLLKRPTHSDYNSTLNSLNSLYIIVNIDPTFSSMGIDMIITFFCTSCQLFFCFSYVFLLCIDKNHNFYHYHHGFFLHFLHFCIFFSFIDISRCYILSLVLKTRPLKKHREFCMVFTRVTSKYIFVNFYQFFLVLRFVLVQN